MNEGKVDADGALLTFHSEEQHFNYVKFNENDRICGTVEKKVVSNQAICGAYYVRNAEIFRQSAQEYLTECPYSEFFVSGVYNVMCRDGGTVRHCEVDFHVPFGTPAEYEIAENFEHFTEFD